MAEPSLGASQPCMVTRARSRRLSTTQSAYLISVINTGRDKQELRRKTLLSCSAAGKAPSRPLSLPRNPSSHHNIWYSELVILQPHLLPPLPLHAPQIPTQAAALCQVFLKATPPPLHTPPLPRYPAPLCHLPSVPPAKVKQRACRR
jgi:hypothetical protein